MVRTVIHLLTEAIPQIVIGKHHDGRAAQVRPECALAAGVEAVAVDQRNGGLRHGSDADGCWL